jgi:hypothetical protein
MFVHTLLQKKNVAYVKETILMRPLTIHEDLVLYFIVHFALSSVNLPQQRTSTRIMQKWSSAPKSICSCMPEKTLKCIMKYVKNLEMYAFMSVGCLQRILSKTQILRHLPTTISLYL